MATRFFDNALADPMRTQRRVAPQLIDGVPATSGAVDFRSNGGPLGISPSTIAPIGIREGGMKATPLLGAYNAAAVSMPLGDLDPGSLGQLYFMANLHRRYTIDEHGGDYNTILMGQAETDPFASVLTVWDDADIGLPLRLLDVRAGGLNLTAGPNTNCALTMPLVFGAHDFFGSPVQTTGSGSTAPYILGTFAGNLEESSTDTDVRIKCTASSGSVRTFKARVGTGTFDGAAFSVTIGGAPVEMIGDDDDVIGTFAESLYLGLPGGATVAVNDEFRFPRRGSRWTASYAPERKITSVSTRVILGGAQRVAVEKGWSLQCSAPGVVRVQDTGGRQAAGTQRSGDLEWQFQITRRLADVLFQKPLYLGDIVEVAIQARHEDRIGSTGVRYGMDVVMPSCRCEGSLYSTAVGGGPAEEVIVLKPGQPEEAYSYRGYELASDVTFVVDTDVTIA